MAKEFLDYKIPTGLFKKTTKFLYNHISARMWFREILKWLHVPYYDCSCPTDISILPVGYNADNGSLEYIDASGTNSVSVSKYYYFERNNNSDNSTIFTTFNNTSFNEGDIITFAIYGGYAGDEVLSLASMNGVSWKEKTGEPITELDGNYQAYKYHQFVVGTSAPNTKTMFRL